MLHLRKAKVQGRVPPVRKLGRQEGAVLGRRLVAMAGAARERARTPPVLVLVLLLVPQLWRRCS